jgi:hypothetical protein
MADDIDTGGPLGTPMGQALQRGLGMLFGTAPAKKAGMVTPPKPVAQVAPVQPVQPAPTIMPPISTNSPQNIGTVVDQMVYGK